MNKPEVLSWEVEVWSEDGPTALRAESYEAETKFAVVGKVGDWPYLHVVEDDVERLITVLAVVDVAEAKLARDAAVRIPSPGAWLWLTNQGTMRVVGASQPLTRKELADVLGGHSPPPTGTTIITR